MIIQLEKTRFHYELKLKIEYGVPSYILESMTEPQLLSMIEDLPKNPWKYYDRDLGFSINLCERLALKFKVDNNLEKCKAYLQYALDSISDQGHCYGKRWQVSSKIKDHNFTDYDIQKAIEKLTSERILFVSEKDNWFLNKYFYAEKDFATMLLKQHGGNGKCTFFRNHCCGTYNILNEKQKEVVDAVEENSLIILTGLPGTGKTTTVKTIVECYGEDNVILLAPTGKAASRLTELTGIQARTLHSFFFNPHSNLPNTVENKIIIIDEISMCDAEIAGFFSGGIHDGNVLILVGDSDQLPSVGPGQVLNDVLASHVGKRYHLNAIMRQKPGSIIQSAHSIHSGNNLVIGSDNEVITYYPNSWDLMKITTKLLNSKEWQNAQILSVLKDKGSKIINDVARSFYYPNSSNTYEVGIKVIHTKNNKDLGVYNGEMGVVVRRTDRLTTVEFKDKMVDYPNSLLWQLDLAYAITVHKSQGSEFDKTVFFVNPSRITTRNILYTGLTRAKNKTLIIAPSSSAISDAINNKQKPRQTSLSWLLKREF